MEGLEGVNVSKLQSKWDTYIANRYENGTVMGCVMSLLDDHLPELKGPNLGQVISALQVIGMRRMPLISRKYLKSVGLSDGDDIGAVWCGLYKGMPISAWLSKSISLQTVEILMTMDPLERYMWLRDKNTRRIAPLDRKVRTARRQKRMEVLSKRFVKARELGSDSGKHDWTKTS